MAEVDEDADLVHLPDRLDTHLAEARIRRLQAAVAQQVPAVVGRLHDADAETVRLARALLPERITIRQAFVTLDDVAWIATHFDRIGVLSVDVDGNDYWIWEALTSARPAIVVIETHTEYRLHDVLAPYRRPGAAAPDGGPVGASPVAMTRLAERLGYRLVGGSRFGFNAFYVQSELAQAVPTVGVEELLRHDWSKEPNEWSEPPAG